ncbi:MAG: methyltransferase [Acidimicrobiia bacterium]
MLEGLRAVFQREGYTEEAAIGRLRLGSELRVREGDTPVHLRRLDRGDALDWILRVFLLGVRTDRVPVEEALGPVALEGLQGAGLVELDAGTVHACVRVTPAAGRWFAHDPSDASGLRPDSVLGWTPAARTLASLTVRRPVGTALDLGTGAGLQALLAADHAGRTVAVDINDRALWLTSVNCALNGVTTVECRQGDLFDPVGDERFDLVVSNPPFVISPASEFMFRDGGRGADSMSREVVTGAAARLVEGGYATVMCNWVIGPDEPWWQRPGSWVEGTGCDALLLFYEALDPVKYAAVWIRHESLVAEEFGPALDSWLAYYRDTGVDRVGIGALVLRRRSGAENWVRKAEIGRGPSGSGSAQLLRIFDHGVAAEADLVGRRLALVRGHRLEQSLSYGQEGYAASPAQMVLDDGVGLRNEVSPEALHVLLRMDGRRTVGDLLAEAADETDIPADVLAGRALASLRQLYELGFVREGAPDGGAGTTIGEAG